MDLAIPPDLSVSSEDATGSKDVVGSEKSKGEEVRSDSGKEIEGKKSESWVDIAQDKKALRKHQVEILEKDGLQTIEIPDEIVDNATPLWEDFVIGKFLDQSPHIAKVHMVLNKIWRYGDSSAKIEVYEVNPTTLRFKVSNPRIREKIVRRGMWNI